MAWLSMQCFFFFPGSIFFMRLSPSALCINVFALWLARQTSNLNFNDMYKSTKCRSNLKLLVLMCLMAAQGYTCLTVLMRVVVVEARAVKSSHCLLPEAISKSPTIYLDGLKRWMLLQLDTRHIWSLSQTEASDCAGKLFGAHHVEFKVIIVNEN